MFICHGDEPAAEISQVFVDAEITDLEFFFYEGSECVCFCICGIALSDSGCMIFCQAAFTKNLHFPFLPSESLKMSHLQFIKKRRKKRQVYGNFLKMT
ncbi:hypothetical protein MY7_2590 [Bacillus sp. 5B6]|nr:hypothetical protein MY7_2590 [Bacillus sp. 5B6]